MTISTVLRLCIKTLSNEKRASFQPAVQCPSSPNGGRWSGRLPVLTGSAGSGRTHRVSCPRIPAGRDGQGVLPSGSPTLVAQRSLFFFLWRDPLQRFQQELDFLVEQRLE